MRRKPYKTDYRSVFKGDLRDKEKKLLRET